MGEEDSFPLEWSSGCESGWTMYLDQSFGRTTCLSAKRADSKFVEEEKEGDFGEEEEEKREEEDEELSMVSDASSGPPQFHEEEDYCDENGCFCPAFSVALVKKSSKRRRVNAEKEPEHSSFLDDTASSHVFHFSKNSFDLTSKQSSMEDVLDFSLGFSATHFKKHYDTVQSSSIPLKPTSTKLVCREEGRRNNIC